MDFLLRQRHAWPVNGISTCALSQQFGGPVVLNRSCSLAGPAGERPTCQSPYVDGVGGPLQRKEAWVQRRCIALLLTVVCGFPRQSAVTGVWDLEVRAVQFNFDDPRYQCLLLRAVPVFVMCPGKMRSKSGKLSNKPMWLELQKLQKERHENATSTGTFLPVLRLKGT